MGRRYFRSPYNIVDVAVAVVRHLPSARSPAQICCVMAPLTWYLPTNPHVQSLMMCVRSLSLMRVLARLTSLEVSRCLSFSLWPFLHPLLDHNLTRPPPSR